MQKRKFLTPEEVSLGCVWETDNIVRLRYGGRVYSRAIPRLARILANRIT
ncbi:hypothetical protein LY104_002156 [Salmonella enterica]|nr:hypothetical protein [Salmonella enterica]EDX6091453.1 hypothetical protein [Salmonella enterica subsp. enterica serovar Urbana]EID9615308.1 hypothetical protein [Salmonella enterica subsp. enterica serovar Poona]EEN6869216.1 hypothetical protein [Salmonella enterica]EFQ7329712.1 hypothetical protein [Salmonella enterica]